MTFRYSGQDAFHEPDDLKPWSIEDYLILPTVFAGFFTYITLELMGINPAEWVGM